VSFSIDRAQTKAAEYQTALLIQAIAHDEVLAEQQRFVYADRQTVLEQPDLRIKFARMLDDLVSSGAMPATAITEYERRESELGAAVMREVERRVLLSVIDATWREHLAAMADLLTGLSIRAAGRAVPLPEYRREAAQLFDDMTATIRQRAVSALLTLKVDVQ